MSNAKKIKAKTIKKQACNKQLKKDLRVEKWYSNMLEEMTSEYEVFARRLCQYLNKEVIENALEGIDSPQINMEFRDFEAK